VRKLLVARGVGIIADNASLCNCLQELEFLWLQGKHRSVFLNPAKIRFFCGGKHSSQEYFVASWRASFNQPKGGRYGEWNSLVVMLLRLGHQRISETL